MLRWVDDLVGAHSLGHPPTSGRKIRRNHRSMADRLQTRDDRQTNWPATEDQAHAAWFKLRLRHRMGANRKRLGHRGLIIADPVGRRQQHRLSQNHPFSEAAWIKIGVANQLHPRRRSRCGK